MPGRAGGTIVTGATAWPSGTHALLALAGVAVLGPGGGVLAVRKAFPRG